LIWASAVSSCLAISGSRAMAGEASTSSLWEKSCRSAIVAWREASVFLNSGPLTMSSIPLTDPARLRPMPSKSMRLILPNSSLAERVMLSAGAADGNDEGVAVAPEFGRRHIGHDLERHDSPS
jgi:hypothetical protein